MGFSSKGVKKYSLGCEDIDMKINCPHAIVSNIGTGLGLRRRINKLYVCLQVCKAILFNKLFGLEHVVILIRKVNKYSAKSILSHFGARVGEDCDIESGIIFHNVKENFAHLIIEDKCHIGKDVLLDLAAPIILHSRTTVSMRTTIITHIDTGHSQLGDDVYIPSASNVEIGPDVYIGSGAIILAGVRIGSGSVIGAGALVNRDIPNGVMAAGVPARVIKKLDSNFNNQSSNSHIN